MNDGLILLDKDIGLTSRKADNIIAHSLHLKKVGHLGTLDPFASGLLVIAVNKGTKFLPYLEDGEKEYEATLKLGYHSSTGDPDGEITKSNDPIPSFDEEKIKSVFLKFLGKQMQLAPLTSAHKVDGVAMYKYAHKGVEMERKSYPIEIFSLELVSFSEDEISFRVKASKGTYIRVLGEDIAKELGSVGYLTSLRRTKIGKLSVEDAVKLDVLSSEDIIDPTPLIDLPHYECDETLSKKVMNGVSIYLNSEEEKLLLIHDGVALAVYKRSGDKYVSERGLF